ncbi:hypothetical protein BH20ACT19_BH20ACT19_11280 [soil metagenome]
MRAKEFPAAMRGYDREAVDAWKEEVAELVTRLEAEPPRDAAVKRALDEVGQETTAILQRAHESADEIESRSRSRAEERIERAEGEAEITVREAEERADRLEEDIRAVWDERVRLLEEMRQLADEVLGVADDALDRLQPPRGREPEEGPVDATGEEVFDEPDSGDAPAVEPAGPGALDDTRVIKAQGGDTQPFDAAEAADAEDDSTDESPPAADHHSRPSP